MSIPSIHSSYSSGTSTVTSAMESLLSRRSKSISNNDNVFIHPIDSSQILSQAAALDSKLSQLSSSSSSSFNSLLSTYPLFGIPFAIKDNIDMIDQPTTAGCPGFKYTATSSAPVVNAIINLGGICLGKTTLDQFATGLVGTRCPYGIASNPYNNKLIPGGSSSGSAVSVSRNLVTFSLGTDTAGSGRVPASLNNLIGIKPSIDLIDTTGVVPACKSLDCVSIFANSINDGKYILQSILKQLGTNNNLNQSIYNNINDNIGCNIAIPEGILNGNINNDSLNKYFLGDNDYYKKYLEMVDSIKDNKNNNIIEIDFEPFFEVARLLYEGPWVCERLWAVPFMANDEECDAIEGVDNTVKKIVSGGVKFQGVDVFDAMYKLERLRKNIYGLLGSLNIDILCVPTIPTSYTIEEINNNPIKLNSNLGLYTNFVNLLDMCAVVIPTTMIKKENYNEPCSVTLIGMKNDDLKVIDIGKMFENNYFSKISNEMVENVIGANCGPESGINNNKYEIAVCGAHMKGFPLNYQLVDRNAKFVRKDCTKAGSYEMYSLENGKKPGMLKNEKNKNSYTKIEVEIWAFEDGNAYADFVANCVPKPLCVGTVELEDGKECKGFIMESYMLDDGNIENITKFEGWRAYKAQEN